MTVAEYFQIVYYTLAFLVAVVPTVITIFKLRKAKRNAKTAEEKEQLTEEMNKKMIELIENAEVFYKSLDNVLKQQGESAGAFKKESVLNKLQTYANVIGLSFNKEYWSNKIDEYIDFSKKVN